MIQKVLLLDGQTVQAISVARALKEKGYVVSAFMDSKLSYGYVSRFIDHKIICPALLKDPPRYLEFLFDFLNKHPHDIILPMYNDSAELVSLHKKEIEEQTKTICSVPEYQTFIKAHNKEILMDICREYDLPHPRTMHLSEHTIQEAADYVKFPSLIKPNISAGARGIVMVNNVQELKEKFPHIEKEFGQCTLQEFIDHTGIYYNVMLYRDRKGVCHESTTIKIMRYFPLKGGTSCYCETIQNKELTRICEETLQALDWHGFADFDIMESKSGALKIIEINPRMPASIHAAYISGINYPEMIIKDFEQDNTPTYHYNYGKAMRFWGLDVMWFLFSPERFSFKPSWFNFFGRNVYYQDGSLKDPLPMFMGVLSGIIKYLNPAFRKSKLQS